MRAVSVSVVLAALVVGATLFGGTAAASHRTVRPAAQNATFPTWSPDGKQIAFVYRPSPKRYRIVRTSSKPGGAVHTVLAARGYCCVQLQWAAYGRILVSPASRLKSLGVHDGKPKRLFFPSCDNSYGCQTGNFILSPGREYAAAAITADDSDPHYPLGIGLVKLEPGRQPAVLASALTAEENSQIWDSVLAFSPDGTQLVFSRASFDGWDTGQSALMAISLAGGDSLPLAQSGIPGASLVPSDAQQVQWSPAGNWVAYVEGSYYTTGQQNLEVVPTTGTGTPRDLATCSGDSYVRFSWSPTSKLIAYDCYSQATGQSSQPMTVGPDGTDLTDLLKGRHLAYVQPYFAAPQWSPDGSRLVFPAHALGHRIVHVWTVRANGSDLSRRG